MEVQFEDSRTALIETNRAAETRLPVVVIQSARRKLNALRAAPDEETLRNWKSFHYAQSYENDNKEGSIALNEGWRMMFRLDDQCIPQKVTIISVEDRSLLIKGRRV